MLESIDIRFLISIIQVLLLSISHFIPNNIINKVYGKDFITSSQRADIYSQVLWLVKSLVIH